MTTGGSDRACVGSSLSPEILNIGLPPLHRPGYNLLPACLAQRRFQRHMSMSDVTQ